jgi:hypothetical protein
MFLATMLCTCPGGQSQTPTTGSEVWPEVDAHIQLPSHLRVLAFAGSQQGVGFPYRQRDLAAGVGYQWKRVSSHYHKNIDPDKEHLLVFGCGYEFIRTTKSGKTIDSGRLTFDGTSGFRLPAEFLIRDRNRIELRWTGSVYSTTMYRNRVSLERDFSVHGFRFNPYGSSEFFYNSAKDSWYQERYSAGVHWPYKRLFALDTYYLRKNCESCSPANLNVAGVTLNFYFADSKKKAAKAVAER